MKNKIPNYYRDARLNKLAFKAEQDLNIPNASFRLIMLLIRERQTDTKNPVTTPFPLSDAMAAKLLGKSPKHCYSIIKNLTLGYLFFVEKKGCPATNWYRLAILE